MSELTSLERKALKTPDPFMLKGRMMLGSLAQQRKRFFPAMIFLIAIAVGAYGYDWWQDSQTEKAWKAYVLAMDLTETQRVESLKKVYEEHSSSRPRFLAAVALADHYFELRKKKLQGAEQGPENSSESIEWYQKALSYSDLISKEKQLLLIDIGKAFELDQKYDDALSQYGKAADLGGDLRALSAIQQARIWELKKDLNKAEQIYQQITTDFPDTEYARLSRNYLRYLKSPHAKN